MNTTTARYKVEQGAPSPKMTVIWTALPNGLVGDPADRRARLSVYVSMRLTGNDGTLADFPKEALNWPTLLAQSGKIEFSVQPTFVQSDGRSPGEAGTPRIAKIV